MTPRSCESIIVTTLLALAIPARVLAQEHGQIADSVTVKEGTAAQHHHYKVIDVGTFGGPQSYFNNLHLTDRFGFLTAAYGFAQVSNGPGILVGFADTATPDPYSANPLFCYVPDCFVAHAYEMRGGVKGDLGVLPGGASSAAFWISSNGLIVGNSQNGATDLAIPGLPDLRAVIWKNRHIIDLGTLGGGWSFAEAVNDRVQITGVALNGIPDPFSMLYQFFWCLPFQICPLNGGQSRGFVWDAEEGMQDIGTLGGPDAFPALINQRGQVAGFSYTDSIPDPNIGLPTLPPPVPVGKGERHEGFGKLRWSLGGISKRTQ